MSAGSFILILFIANSGSTGAAGISQQFDNQAACIAAGRALVANTTDRYNFVLTWGCFAKGGAAWPTCAT